MPTYDEFEELRNLCSWTWTARNGVNGYEVKGPNGKAIFLPAAGHRYGSDLGDVGNLAYYWSASLDKSYCRYALTVYIYSGYYPIAGMYRSTGLSVRPVYR